ncbi:rod shape-determining protein MreC [Liquorilactobacillus hordei DSM 19519]|uniref:Cell shape-determining protein MreC n=2 Tax=Liquorilactobacillus hordei TaxID=468911 RepID=A0A0R1MFK9_9LACO|nr:rod shape-determining protein MreC [Liquorilactobacillus hordei DSM 19519]
MSLSLVEEIMQRFFFNKRLIIVLVTVIIGFVLVAFSVTVRNNKSTPPIIQQFGNDVAGLVDRVVSYPVSAVGNAGGAVENLLNTYQENQKLKKQVDNLASEKVSNQTIRKENAALKKQLKLNKSLTNYTAVTSYVIARTPSSWQNQIIISKGSLAGVKKNASVLSDKGLIGRVTEVNKTNSKVELISTTNDNADRFATTILTDDGSVNGLITNYNSNTNRLIMGQIDSKKTMKKGDKVITSGMGGNSPQGIYVGTVMKVEKDDYGLATKVEIKPAADLTNLNVVTVAERTD